jgi:hypothetical protein
MKITSVTPIKQKVDSKAGVEVSVGEFDEVTTDWYRTDINSLHDELEDAGIDYLEYTLMRKAVGAENGLLVALVIYGTAQAFDILKAWLPARQSRKVRVKFKDGSEIEATTVKELEHIRDKFLTQQPEETDDED